MPGGYVDKKTRVLVAFEMPYLVYGEAIASAIRVRCSPRVDVAVGKAETLRAELSLGDQASGACPGSALSK